MVHCNEYNCLEDSRKQSGKLQASAFTKPEKRTTFFTFPKDPTLRRIWVRNMRLENFVVKDHSRLCEKHFEEDQFEVSRSVIESLGWVGKKQLKLKKDAVPTIFDRGPPKSTGQMKGKISFKRKKQELHSNFQSKFMPTDIPKRMSPIKRYGAYVKRRRLEVRLLLIFFWLMLISERK